MDYPYVLVNGRTDTRSTNGPHRPVRANANWLEPLPGSANQLHHERKKQTVNSARTTVYSVKVSRCPPDL